jgi:hypothetical protein
MADTEIDISQRADALQSALVAIGRRADALESRLAASDEPDNCAICFGLPVEPTHMDCRKHIFCFQCIIDHLSLRGDCPICLQRIKFVATQDRIYTVRRLPFEPPVGADELLRQAALYNSILVRNFTEDLADLQDERNKIDTFCTLFNFEYDHNTKILLGGTWNFPHLVNMCSVRCGALERWCSRRIPSVIALSLFGLLAMSSSMNAMLVLATYAYDPYMTIMFSILSSVNVITRIYCHNRNSLRSTANLYISILVAILVFLDMWGFFIESAYTDHVARGCINSVRLWCRFSWTFILCVLIRLVSSREQQ